MTFYNAVLELSKGRCKGIRRPHWSKSVWAILIWDYLALNVSSHEPCKICPEDVFAMDWEIIPNLVVDIWVNIYPPERGRSSIGGIYATRKEAEKGSNGEAHQVHIYEEFEVAPTCSGISGANNKEVADKQ
jgi:hypothetical protein